jgi:hypothetical protein
MAIVRTDPYDFESANTVQIDSDAKDNSTAMREIEDWAAEHGYRRTSEFWLRRINTPEHGLLFRGICYRVTEDERATLRAESDEVQARIDRMPATPHMAD